MAYFCDHKNNLFSLRCCPVFLQNESSLRLVRTIKEAIDKSSEEESPAELGDSAAEIEKYLASLFTKMKDGVWDNSALLPLLDNTSAGSGMDMVVTIKFYVMATKVRPAGRQATTVLCCVVFVFLAMFF
jgi:hypothetical protein